MTFSHESPNPWQQTHNNQKLRERVVGFVEGKDSITIDLGSAFPGDLVGENFVTGDLQKAKWLFDTLGSIFRESNEKELILRFSDQKIRESFEKNCSGPWKARGEGTTLSFYDSQKESNESILSLYDLLALVQSGNFWNGVELSSEDQFRAPLCLWGDVEQIGHHWVDLNQTFAEVFEILGNAGPRPQLIFVNGPLGETFHWTDLKGKRLREFSFPIRTLHFFKDKSLDGLMTVWNEFFREDSCKECLPCSFGRKGMTEANFVDSFRGKAHFNCHLPRLYRKAGQFKEFISDGQPGAKGSSE